LHPSGQALRGGFIVLLPLRGDPRRKPRKRGVLKLQIPITELIGIV